MKRVMIILLIGMFFVSLLGCVNAEEALNLSTTDVCTELDNGALSLSGNYSIGFWFNGISIGTSNYYFSGLGAASIIEAVTSFTGCLYGAGGVSLRTTFFFSSRGFTVLGLLRLTFSS